MTFLRALILVFLIYPALIQEVARAQSVNTIPIMIEDLAAQDRAAIGEGIKK